MGGNSLKNIIGVRFKKAGKVYYFDKVTGKMIVGQKNIGGHWYLFDSKGAM